MIDTNVVSELVKPKAEIAVVAFFENHPVEELSVSEITFAEIRFGITKRSADPAWQETTQKWLDDTLRPLFAESVFGITEGVLLDWRLKIDEGRKNGYTFPQPDLFIAVIAQREDLVVVSRDIKPYVNAGVPVLNPWKAEFHSASGRRYPVSKIKPAKLLSELTKFK